MTYGLNPDVPDRTAVDAVPDVASFDALDAWWAETDRTGDANAAHDYASDFQKTADRAESTWDRAEALEGDLFHAMDLENTPAAFTDDRYDYDDDVWMADAAGSEDLERELTEHVQANPDMFTGTDYEPYLHVPAPGDEEPGDLGPVEGPAEYEGPWQDVEPGDGPGDDAEIGDDQ